MKILLLGATGFTGQLLLSALIKQGLKPVAVGRRQQALEALQAQHPEIDIAVVNVQNERALAAIVDKGDVVISTVGPFSELGHIPLQVAVDRGAHYIDSTGEPGFIANVYGHYESALKYSHQVILTACGYDYVPGQLMAEVLLESIDPQQIATLNIAYATPCGQLADVSSGTLSTLIRALYEQGVFYQDGKWQWRYLCRDSWRIATKGRVARCLSLAGIECLELPRAHSQLMNVNIFLGWFGALAPFVQGFNRAQQCLFYVPGFLPLMRWLSSKVNLPRRKASSIIRDDSSDVYLYAEALDAQDQCLASATLEGHNMYQYTADIMAWMAAQIYADRIEQYGVVGPARAFGARSLKEAHQSLGLHWQVSIL